MQRKTYPYHLSDFTSPHSSAIYKIFTSNITLICRNTHNGVDTRNRTMFQLNTRHLDIFDNFDASGSSTFCQGLCCILRIGVTVIGLKPGSLKIIRMQKGKHPFGFVQADFLHHDAERSRHLHGPVEFLFTIFCLGDAYGSWAQITCGLTGLLL